MKAEPEIERLKATLAENKKELDALVLQFLPKTHKSKQISNLYEMMRDYPSRGGKGLRGTLCIMWCELFGGRREEALVTAAALELFQNWILIHDDIEDKSDMRRGAPALHKKYGLELAINVGDALHGKMWELLLTNSDIIGKEATLEILSEFANMLNETTEGQQMELAWTTHNEWDIDEEDYLLMVTKKAAWYTCISPSRMGAIIAVRSLSSLTQATSFGKPIHAIITNQGKRDKHPNGIMERLVGLGTDLGISFQIIDDVLNLTAEESKYGKEILGDLYEGKRTLMVIHLLRKSDESTRSKIIGYLSKRREEKSREEMKYVFNRMKEYGSIDYAIDFARKHSEKALSEFDELTRIADGGITSDRCLELRGLLEYLTNRDY
ncbi:MAG TPA: polyprenyl synthetase family protein [Nitrososphaerales archaeon]|nr:polyprenyl synthetase family protein [Nitrososphaerales archaeon]